MVVMTERDDAGNKTGKKADRMDIRAFVEAVARVAEVQYREYVLASGRTLNLAEMFSMFMKKHFRYAMKMENDGFKEIVFPKPEILEVLKKRGVYTHVYTHVCTHVYKQGLQKPAKGCATHIAVHVSNYLRQGKAGYFQQLHAKVTF